MKRYFLVDYEAVQNLDGIENLTESDVVILLFMDESKGVSFRTLAKMNASKAEVQQKFVNGKNETDMCYAVAFLVGQISAKGDEIILIGKSSDFSLFLKTFTEDANIRLSDYESIEKCLENEPEKKFLTQKKEQKIEQKEAPQKTTFKPTLDYSLAEEEVFSMICEARKIKKMDANTKNLLHNLFEISVNSPTYLSSEKRRVSTKTGYSENALSIYIAWYKRRIGLE